MKLTQKEIALLKQLKVCEENPYTFYLYDIQKDVDAYHVKTRNKLNKLEAMCNKYGAEFKLLDKVMVRCYVEITDPLAATIERLNKPSN